MRTNKDHKHKVKCKNISNKDRDLNIDFINNNNSDNMKNKYISKRKIPNFDYIICKPRNNNMQDK